MRNTVTDRFWEFGSSHLQKQGATAVMTQVHSPSDAESRVGSLEGFSAWICLSFELWYILINISAHPSRVNRGFQLAQW